MNILTLHSQYKAAEQEKDQYKSQIQSHLADAVCIIRSIYEKRYAQKFTWSELCEDSKFSWMKHYSSKSTVFTLQVLIDPQGNKHPIASEYFQHNTWEICKMARYQLREYYKRHLMQQVKDCKQEIAEIKTKKASYEKMENNLLDKQERASKQLNKVITDRLTKVR